MTVVALALADSSVADPGQFGTDPHLCLADPVPAIFVNDLQDVNKKYFIVFCLMLFKGEFISFKEVTKQ